MTKIVLIFGLISGLIISAMFVVTIPFQDRIDMSTGMVIGYASMLAASLLIYFGVRSYRDGVGQGRISFGRAFAVGMLIVAVSNTLYVTTWRIVYPRYMPDFYEKYQEHQLESARAKGATPAEIEALRVKTTKDLELYTQPAMNILFTFAEPLPVGLLVSLISAWMLSRRRRDETLMAATA